MNKEKSKFGEMFEHLLKLYNLSERDEIIFGDSFIEFRERSIKVLDPSDKIIQNLDKEVIQTSRKQTEAKLYGKSILENYGKSIFENYKKVPLKCKVKDLIDDLVNIYGVKSISMDNSGLNKVLIEELKEKGIKVKINKNRRKLKSLPN